MREIPLTRGLVAIVDDEDYEWLNQWKWHALKDKDAFYAARCAPRGVGSTHSPRMHRVILNVSDPKIQVDHRNRNSLDNRRENLRIATHGQNSQNRGKLKSNTSGYKGVTWSTPHKKWRVYIKSNGRSMWLGSFDDPREGARAYDEAALRYHGEFATLNFPERKESE